VTLFDPAGAKSPVTPPPKIITQDNSCFQVPPPNTCSGPSTLVGTITYTVTGQNGSITLQ